jgi:hypothetical protein
VSHDNSESRKESASEDEYLTAAEEEIDEHNENGMTSFFRKTIS